MICEVVLERVRNVVACAEIKRRIRNSIVKSVKEAYAFVVNLAEIETKLKRVIAVDPRNIVRYVVDRSDTADWVCLVVGKKHKAKGNVVSRTISAFREGLTSESVPEIVNPIVSDGPRMTRGNASRVAPYLRGDRVRKSLRECLMIVNHVAADKKALFAIDRVIEPQYVRV